MSTTNNNKINRNFFVIGGSVMTSGGSLNLAKGQVGIFSNTDADENGQKAIASFAGRSKKDRYLLKCGIENLPVTRSTSNKSMSSFPFSINDVVDVSVSAPKTTEQEVDEVILGFNGVDADTAITLIRADRKKISVELSGEILGYLGYPDNRMVTEVYLDPAKDFGTDDCVEEDNCDPVNAQSYVLEAIKQLRRFQLRGGVPMSELVDITPVQELTGAPAETTSDRFFQTLEIADSGDQAALALVQAQYPTNKIVRVSRDGVTSVYQVITLTNSLLSDYEQSLASRIKGCADCPAGYSELDGGFVYAVSLEDDGVNLSTTVDNLANAITASVEKQGQDAGVGYYTIVLTAELSDANRATFVSANPTATVALIGEIASVCANATTEDTSWVLGDTCQVATREYNITLPDTNCGENRLAELQGAYPNLTIAIETDSIGSSKTVTLTGTSGTANVVIAGVNYLATFATSLTVTATNFVTLHGATLAALGYDITSSGAVITLKADTLTFPTITVANVTTNLAGTVSAITDDVTIPVALNCQTKYVASVITNMVCDECSDIFKDFFVAEAPAPYDQVEWKEVVVAGSTASLMGIRFKGKKLEVRSNEYLRDIIGFTDSSVMIRVSGGHLDEVRAGINPKKDEPMAVTYLSRWKPRTHLGGSLQHLEDRDRVYFLGEPAHYDALTRVLFTGGESSINQSAQYVDYAITLRRTNYATIPTHRHEETLVYHIHVKVGRHLGVENLVNSLAGAAGIDGVQAFGNV